MIYNRLVNNQSDLKVINSGDNWRTTNFTFGDYAVSELWPTSAFRQIGLTPIDNQQNSTIYISGVNLPSTDIDRTAVFTFAVKMPNGGHVSVHIDDDNQINNYSVHETIISPTTSSVNVSGLASLQWSIIRCDSVVISNAFNPSISIAITISNLPNNTDKIYFSLPAVYMQSDAWTDNPAMKPLVKQIPRAFLDIDAAVQTAVSTPFIRLLDVCSHNLDDAVGKTIDFQYFDQVERGFAAGIEMTSTLVETPRAEIPTLSWLAKFTGTIPVTRFLASLPDSNAFILDSSVLDSSDTLRFSSYSELNPPASTTLEQLKLLRWQIDNAYYGRNAGTKDALTSAASLMLIGTKYVDIDYDYENEPFVVNVSTYWNETFGADETMIGQESQFVMEALAAAKPVGVKLTHTLLPSM